MLSIPTLAGIFLLLTLYKFVIFPIYLSPLSKIPNAHPLAPVTPFWILWRRYLRMENVTVHAAHQKHGPVVRLAPNEVSVNCVKGGIQTVYFGGFDKHDFYPNQFKNFNQTPNMFSTLLSKPHSARKRMISNIYSKSYLQSSDVLASNASVLMHQRFMPRLSDAAQRGSTINIYSLFSGILMDFVTTYQFGLASGSNFTMNDEQREHFLDEHDQRQGHTFWNAELPWLRDFLTMVGLPVVPEARKEANYGIEDWIIGMQDGANVQHTAEADSPGTEEANLGNIPVVYSQLKNAMDKAGKDTTTDSEHQRFEIASELADHLLAGFDTSGITLTYLVHEMSQRPKLQEALREELRTLNPPIAPPSAPKLPSPKDLDALPLLHAIMQETLRRHPAIPGSEPRVTPPGGCTLGPNCEYTNIPGNVRISAQAYSLHRNADVFPAPETWKPERWLNGKGEVIKDGEMARWFWAFGSGGRMCVGSNLAIYQMKHVIAAIYSNFVTTIVDDKGIEQEDAYTARPRAGKLTIKLEAV